MEPTIVIPKIRTVPANSQVSATGEEVVTFELGDVVGPSQEVAPVVSAKKSSNGHGVKRSLSSNTAPQCGDANQAATVSDVYYPAYIFQSAPSKLKIEELRRHACISEIKKNDAMCNFFELAKGLLGPMKDALIAAGHNTNSGGTPKTGEHCYGANIPTLD